MLLIRLIICVQKVVNLYKLSLYIKMSYCKVLSFPKVSFQNNCNYQKRKIYTGAYTPQKRRNNKFQLGLPNKQYNQKYKKNDYKFVPNLKKNNKFSLDISLHEQNNNLSNSFSKAKNQQNQQTKDGDNLQITNESAQIQQTQLIDNSKIHQKNPCNKVIQSLKMLVPSKKDKNYTKFDQLIQKLKIINPFFSKLPSGSAYLLLKIGKVITIPQYKVIYQIDSLSKFFYIILYGKVFLKDSKIDFVKYSKTGQALAQQQIFVNQAQYTVKMRQQSNLKHLQAATTQIETCLLRINKKKYYQLQHQMYEKGNACKTLFTQINNSLKVQYLSKQMSRNQAKDKRNKKFIRRYHTEF